MEPPEEAAQQDGHDRIGKTQSQHQQGERGSRKQTPAKLAADRPEERDSQSAAQARATGSDGQTSSHRHTETRPTGIQAEGPKNAETARKREARSDAESRRRNGAEDPPPAGEKGRRGRKPTSSAKGASNERAQDRSAPRAAGTSHETGRHRRPRSPGNHSNTAREGPTPPSGRQREGANQNQTRERHPENNKP